MIIRMRGVFIELIVKELKIEGKQIRERIGKREKGLDWGGRVTRRIVAEDAYTCGEQNE
jgi:hypothetical protein